jgi:hypothetical protein
MGDITIGIVSFSLDGVAKGSLYGVAAFFQDLDILDVCLHP